MGVSTTPRPLYPWDRPRTHCTGGWVGPRAGLDECGKISPPTGIRSPYRSARSESLYRLSYPGRLRYRGFRNYIISLNIHHREVFQMNMTKYGVLPRIHVEIFHKRTKLLSLIRYWRSIWSFFVHI